MDRRPYNIIGWVWVVVFVLFAAVQYNDPDPLVWIGIYGGMAALCAAGVYRKVPWWLSAAIVCASVAGAVSLWPMEYQGLTGKMDSRPGVELARESLGLVICAIAAGFVSYRAARKRPAHR